MFKTPKLLKCIQLPSNYSIMTLQPSKLWNCHQHPRCHERPQPQSSQQRSEPRHLLGEVETHWPWWIAWPQESSSGVSSFCSCKSFKDLPTDNAIHHPVLLKSLYCKGQPHATDRDLSRIWFNRKVLVMTLFEKKTGVMDTSLKKVRSFHLKNPRVEDYHVWGPWFIKAPNSQG